jgi:hypothetical protein
MTINTPLTEKILFFISDGDSHNCNLNSTVLRDVTPYSLVEVYERLFRAEI